MTSLNITLYLHLLLNSLPPMIVCLGACVVILAKWKTGASWCLWGFLGFGLGLLVTIAVPITQVCVQSWIMQTGNVSHYTWIFPALGLVWSLLHACAYVLIFIAVVEGRK